MIACGFFDITKGVIVSGNRNERDKFFGYQLCGIVVIGAWVFSLNCVVFFIMKKCGILRVPLVDEIVGLDISECGQPFPEFLTSKDESKVTDEIEIVCSK